MDLEQLDLEQLGASDRHLASSSTNPTTTQETNPATTQPQYPVKQVTMSHLSAVTGITSMHSQSAFALYQYEKAEQAVAAARQWMIDIGEKLQKEWPPSVRTGFEDEFSDARKDLVKAREALDEARKGMQQVVKEQHEREHLIKTPPPSRTGSVHSGFSLISSPQRCALKRGNKRDTKHVRARVKACYENLDFGKLWRDTDGVGLELTCAITKRTGYAEKVRAAHILPHSANDEEMVQVGLKDINSNRNMIPLAIGVEKNFDLRRVTIMPIYIPSPVTLQGEEEEKKEDPSIAEEEKEDSDILAAGEVASHDKDGAMFLKLVVLDASARTEEIYPDSKETIGDFEGKPFACPFARTPSSMVLSYHVEKAYERAINKKWISENEQAEDFTSPVRNNLLCFDSEDHSMAARNLHVELSRE